jgi:hypothetical protein
MKRALITGGTNKHIGHVTKTNGYVSAIDLYKPMLVDLGYKVEHRAIDLYEDVSKYDLVLCGLGCLGSIINGYGYNTIHLMQFDNVMYYIDDWQVKPVFASLVNAYKNDKLFTDFILAVNKANLSKSTKKRLMENLSQFLDSNPYILFPMFNCWGDRNIMHDHLSKTFDFRMLETDPSPFVKLPQLKIDYLKKKKVWLCASLKRPKLPSKDNFTWPIEYFNRKDGYVSEHDLFTDYYARYWGNISLKYPHVGSGYWRMRFMHSINSLSIIFTNEKEVEKLGNSFLTPLSVIEKSTSKDLRDIALLQKYVILDAQLSKEDTLYILEDHIKRALDVR